MKYTVVWSPEAEDDLTSLWGAAPNRAAFTRVIEAVEIRLARNPQAVGESRDDMNHRVAIEPPIGVLFDVFPADQIVRVTHIGWLPPPRK